MRSPITQYAECENTDPHPTGNKWPIFFLDVVFCFLALLLHNTQGVRILIRTTGARSSFFFQRLVATE